MVGLARVQNGRSRVLHLRVASTPTARTPSESAMSPGPHSAKAMPGIFRSASALASAYLSSSLTPSSSSPFGLSGHASAFVKVLVLRYAPDFAPPWGRHARRAGLR